MWGALEGSVERGVGGGWHLRHAVHDKHKHDGDTIPPMNATFAFCRLCALVLTYQQSLSPARGCKT